MGNIGKYSSQIDQRRKKKSYISLPANRRHIVYIPPYGDIISFLLISISGFWDWFVHQEANVCVLLLVRLYWGRVRLVAKQIFD